MGFCDLTWAHSPSESSFQLENACLPLGSARLANDRWGQRHLAQSRPVSWDLGCASGGH